jgi:hypothetical protein
LVLGVDDAAITNAAMDVDKVGIDCPLGGPDDFLLFLQEHHAGHVVPRGSGRSGLAAPACPPSTDRAVRESTWLS